jgi:multicomponent Na+:H+ antiporter subunit B
MMDIFLLSLLVLCALAAVSMRDLLSAGILLSAYSLLMAVVWTQMNAVDVAFTEASVGAGITTVLLIAALSRTARGEALKPSPGHAKRVFVIVAITALTLVYGTLDMPDYGDPNNPAYHHVAPRYMEKSEEESGVLNMVTAVLANYRGYDTLGETTVIFAAGTCVILLLRRTKDEEDE